LGLAAGSVAYTQFQNAALGTALPALVLIMLKNGNLVANMLVCAALLRRRYGLQQIAGVLCITCGLILTSIAGQKDASAVQGASGSGSAVLGGLLLGCALLSRAVSGCVQEVACNGSVVQEVLFFRSLLGLPAVLLHWRSIREHVVLWSSSAASLEGFQWWGPWQLLAANVVFDHAARVCVTHLIDRTSALTANLVLTLQRFVSFVISALFLSQGKVGLGMWLGAVAVVLGSLLYLAEYTSSSTPETKKSD